MTFNKTALLFWAATTPTLMFAQQQMGAISSPSVNGQLNAARYCSTPGTLDQTCVQNAVAIDTAGAAIFVPAGSYSGTTSTITDSSVNLILDPGASLNYTLNFNGAGYARTNTTAATGSYAVGVSSFSGSFAALSGCSTVMVEQVVPTSSNQVGSEFFTLVSATSTTLTISGATRYTYQTPNISCVSGAAQASGTIAAGSLSVSGNFTSTLAVGNYVRVDNVTGMDDPGLPGNSYFEIAKVSSITTSAVTFESALHAIYGNPWLVKMSMTSNISIKGGGGYVKTLGMSYVANSTVSGLAVQSFNSLWMYNFSHANIVGNGGSSVPVAYGLTFAWHGTVTNSITYGGLSSSDNANFKVGQVQDVAFSGVTSWNDVATAQGAYGIMVDTLFTPYTIWNANDSFSGMSQNSPGNAAYFAGLRNSTISSLSSMGGIEFMLSSQLEVNGASSLNGMQIRSGDNYHITGLSANAISIGDDMAVTNSSIGYFHIGDCSKAEIAGRCVWIRTSSSNISFSHGNFLPTTSGNQDFFINDSSETNMYFDDIVDSPGSSGFSIYNSGGATTYIGVNRFTGAIQGTVGPTNIPSITTASLAAQSANFTGTNPQVTDANTTVTGVQISNTTTGGHSWAAGAVGSSGMLGCTVGEWGAGDLTSFGNGLCYSGSAGLSFGGAYIANSSKLPQVGTPTAGQAACIKAAGPPVVIGYCSTVVSSTGACTCN